MAVKGKKKARTRGSQARRRPASAPRPSYGGREKPRWYQTTAGLVGAFLAVVTLGIFVWWFVADNRSEAEALQANQDQLETYTASLDGALQSISPVATDLATASTLDDAELAKQVKDWKTKLGAAQTAVAQATPPRSLEPLTGLTSQAVLLYVQSVEQYELLPDLEGKARDAVAAKAAGSFSAASNIFASAIELLDRERQKNDLGSSRLTAPGSPPEDMSTSTEIQVPAEEGAEKGDE